tara:strand:- start:664 stop:1392 length:729 start_codon:yes stop_codon:yes gene_type:complete
MTLLSISNAVADETKGPRPTTIAGNNDPAAQNILRTINKCGQHLTLAYDWNILRVESTVTAPGVETLVSASNMPSNFGRFVPETMWDRSTNNLISGPISPVEWNGLKIQTFSSANKKFIFRGGAILTVPTIGSGVTVAYEYVKKNWCDVAAGGSEKAAMTIDTDVTLIDEELVIRYAVYEWLSGEGQPFQMALKSFEDYFNILTDTESASANVAVVADIFALNSRHFEGSPKASRSSYGGDF